jgi:hypothetical protein
MRRLTVPLAFLSLALAPPASAPEPLDSDRRALLDHLERSRKLFVDSVAGLKPQQAAWKPAEDRWSIAEVAEHLAASEDFIRQAVSGLLAAEAGPEQLAGAVQDDRVKSFIVDRSQKFQAPEPVQPAGRWPSLEATMAHFAESRAETIRLVRASGDLRAHAGEHPAFGNLDAVGWIYFLSGHTERHTLQIEEVKATPGFPAG